jgi:hypothetical protein
MTRTDVHRPSVIDPSEYEYVSMEHINVGASGDIMGDCAYLQACRGTIQAHMARTRGTYSTHAHGGNCHVCGASCIYTVLFYHASTNTYVRTGMDCADKMGYTGADFNAFKKAVTNALEARAGKRKAQATLAAAGLSACWQIYLDGGAPFHSAGMVQDLSNGVWHRVDGQPWSDADQETFWAAYREHDRNHKEEGTVRDIVTNLVKYGSLSPAQESYLQKLLVRIAERPAREAARKAEQEAAANCPTGRITVEGVILTMREQESEFGTVTKILVKHDTGYKVWGTRPGKDLWEAKVGDRVSFKATVTPSDKDLKFGFYSRPMNGKMIQTANQPASIAV